MFMRMIKSIVAAIGVLVVLTAYARDTRLQLPLKDALETEGAKSRLDPNIRFYFGSQAHPKPLQSFGSFTSNKKTNFFNKSDKEGCEWAFLSAMLSFQDRVRREGGNAVIGIKSIYRGGDFSSDTQYECGAGAVTGGVSLRGEVVKLP
jgi:hypothetical protein